MPHFIMSKLRAQDTANKRLKFLRSLCGKREEFALKHGINVHSLRSWEFNLSKVSYRGIEKLIEAFEAEGISVNAKWLIDGIGTPPLFLGQKAQEKTGALLPYAHHLETINGEMSYFLSLSPHRVVHVIEDTLTIPAFYPKDIVGGVLIDPHEYPHFYGKYCIIKIKEEEAKLWVRLLIPGKDYQTYHLITSQSNVHTSEEANLYNVDMDWCAPIIWWRRAF